MSITNASDTRAFIASPLSQGVLTQQEVGERHGVGSSNTQAQPDNAGLLGVKKRATNGHIQDTSRRVVSDDLGSRAQPAKKRTSRYSAGFLLDSLSNLNRKKRKQELAEPDTATAQTGTTQAQRLSLAGTPSSSLDGSSSRRSEPSPVPESSFRASTSDRTSTPDYGNGYLSPSRSSKGKERASSGIGEGTSWSMNSPRTSLGIDGARPGSAQYASPYVQPIDPTTLVQLALNLSQSRRMNLAPGLLAQNNSPNGRRAVSAGYSPMNDGLQPGSSSLGGSLRLDKSGQYNRMSSTSMEERLKQKSSLESAPSAPDNALLDLAPFQASAGTLARAAKAQAFFQLSSEYRRLLQFLPPLKPRTQLTEDAPLGRAYNPLQCIRNKQVRARRRELIDTETIGWTSVDRVGVWVDMVEVDAQYPEYWSGDVARLQRFTPPGRHRSSSAASTVMSDETAADVKQKLSATIDWSMHPALMLADAYWMEQGTHKTLIETKDGKGVFETFEPPQMDTIEEDTWQLNNQITDSPQSINPDSPIGTRRRRSSAIGNGRRSFSPRSTASDDNEMSTVGFSPISHTHKKRGLPGRLLRGRRRAQSAELTEDSGSDNERRLHLGTRGSPKYDNTGPLQKQMQKMIEREYQSQPMDTLHEMSPIEQSNSGGRRAAVSDEHQDLERPRLSTDHGQTQSNRVSQDNTTPRISISDFETGASVIADDHGSRPGSAIPTTKRRRRASRLNFFHKQSADIHEDNQIEATDFALKEKPKKLSPRGSPHSNPRSKTGSQSNLRHEAKQTKSGDDDDAGSTTGMFFKGSRLGDIVRKERPRVSDFIKRTVRNESISASDPEDGRVNAILLSDSDSDDENLSGKKKSHSSNDLHGYYGTNELPTFRSTRVRDDESPHSQPSDHIRRQSQALRDQKRSSRFEENRLSLKTGSNDVSPSTSNVDLARLSTAPSAQRGRPKDRYGRTLSPDDYTDSSRSRSPALKAARRLNDVLAKPGAPGPDAGLPVTGLGRLIAKRGHSSRPEKDKHMGHSTTITSKDIAYLRSMLTLTGVKAQTIIHRANAVRDPVPSYILEAASLSNAALAPVTRRQEHVLVASLLSQTLEESIAHVTEDAHAFRNETCTGLHKRLDDLRETLTAKLMPAVRASGDEADTFVAQLTTTHTLSIKQVNDGVDALVRNRRRRLRLLRNVGFKGLEWVVVCVLWIVWLVVSVLRVVRLLVVGVGRSVKWAFWAS